MSELVHVEWPVLLSLSPVVQKGTHSSIVELGSMLRDCWVNAIEHTCNVLGRHSVRVELVVLPLRQMRIASRRSRLAYDGVLCLLEILKTHVSNRPSLGRSTIRLRVCALPTQFARGGAPLKILPKA